MKRFVEGEDRNQSTLFPERLDEYIAEDNPIRVIDVFVDELILGDLGFERVIPQVTGDSVEKLGTRAGVRFFEGSRSCGGVVIGCATVANYC